MIRVFFEGLVLGLVVSMTFGPAFFAIIQTSIDRGFKPALYTSIGVLLCDFLLIIVCYFGLTSIYEPENNIYIGFIGGVILIIFGTYTYLKKPEILKRRSPKYKTPAPTTKQFKYVVKGFFMNIANPFIFVFWLTAMGWVSARAVQDNSINAVHTRLINYVIVFFTGTLIMIFSSDLLKCFVGYKIKKYLRPRVQLWINRVVGISLIIFGVVLMIRVIREF